MAAKVERIPYGVGRWSAGWGVLIVIALAVLALGVFAFTRQLTQGLVVTGMRDVGSMGGAPWGLYISFDVYFVGVSFSGITIAALIRLLNLENLRSISRMAELLTVVSLILAAFTILPDLGRPGLALVNLPLYARPQSPFFGTFTLVIAGYLFSSLVFLYLAGRKDAALCAQVPSRLRWFYRLWAAGYRDTPQERERHSRTSWWLALAILPLLVTAHSTLGFVFGIQIGRPGWFSTLQAPGFVILAGVSGIGLLIVIAALLRRALGLQEQLNLRVFTWLGNFLWVLTAGYLYFLVAELLTTTYAAHHHEARVTSALFSGPYAWVFWTSVGLLVVSFIILLVQFLARRYILLWVVIPGLLVNLASIGKRYVLVAPSLTHGTLLPYPPGVYSPTWVEYSIILGLFALGTLLYVLFIKVFPILEVPERAKGGA